jgi:phosphatidylglycerophosphate synthase
VTGGDGRAVTDELLAGLRAGRWRPSAWARLLASATRQSICDAAARPYALVEVAVLHAGFAVVARRRGRAGLGWVGASGVLAATHLGLLGARRSVGAATAVTLLRANLPAFAPEAGRWLGAAALGLDLADGRLARAGRTETVFGQYADALADTAFWTWYAYRQEPSRLLRAAALATWAVPVLAVTTLSVARGRMVDPPRPAVARPAAAMQAVLALRALLRRPAPAVAVRR